jgi:hypothetical protein
LVTEIILDSEEVQLVVVIHEQAAEEATESDDELPRCNDVAVGHLDLVL